MREIKLTDIARDHSTQARVNGTQDHIVAEYAAAMRDGATFPAVLLYRDSASTSASTEAFYIADGFHRVEAARIAGLETINAEVKEGTQRDAWLAALAANENHGLRRTNEDRRNAVREALSDPELAQWSDRKIAEACQVSHTFVAKERRGLTGKGRGGNVASTEGGNVASDAANDKPSTREGRLLWSVSDEALIDECRRRGLVEVEA